MTNDTFSLSPAGEMFPAATFSTLPSAFLFRSAIAEVAKKAKVKCVALSAIGPRSEAELRRVIKDVVLQCGSIPVVVGGAGARRHLRAVFDAGAQFAETAEELVQLSEAAMVESTKRARL